MEASPSVIKLVLLGFTCQCYGNSLGQRYFLWLFRLYLFQSIQQKRAEIPPCPTCQALLSGVMLHQLQERTVIPPDYPSRLGIFLHFSCLWKRLFFFTEIVFTSVALLSIIPVGNLLLLPWKAANTLLLGVPLTHELSIISYSLPFSGYVTGETFQSVSSEWHVHYYLTYLLFNSRTS